MKSLKFYIGMVVLFSFYSSYSQATEAVTDEELKKYAVVMDSIEDMRQALLNSVSEAVKNNDQITASRYNELSKIIKDTEKLQAAKATEAEIAVVTKVQADKEEGSTKIQDTFKTLVKDMLGAATYNKVKKALASDAELKTKYDAIVAEINKSEESD